jgi:hypothetical protein
MIGQRRVLVRVVPGEGRPPVTPDLETQCDMIGRRQTPSGSVRSPTHGVPWSPLRVGLAIVLVVATGTAVVLLFTRPPSGPAVNRERAEQIAREYFTTIHAGQRVLDVEITSADLRTDVQRRPVWQISIHGGVIEPGRSSPTYVSHMWLDVDAQTGSVTVAAQG